MPVSQRFVVNPVGVYAGFEVHGFLLDCCSLQDPTHSEVELLQKLLHSPECLLLWGGWDQQGELCSKECLADACINQPEQSDILMDL